VRAGMWISWIVLLAATSAGACSPLRMTAVETGTGGDAMGAAGTGGSAAGTGGGGGGSGGTASAGTSGGGTGGTGRGGAAGTAEPPGLIAFWRFNENSSTTVEDSSGFGQPLMLSTGGGWTTGHEGAGFAFDGINDVAGVVPQVGQRLYDYPVLQLTFSAWVRPGPAAASREFATVVARTHEDYAFQDFWLGLVNGRPSCTIHSPYQEGPVASAVLSTTSWTHIACTHGVSGTVTLYVNGAFAASGNSGQNLGPIPTAILVGASETMQPSVLGQYFPGAIDDVRIYNRTLMPSEVQSIAR